MTFHDEPLEPHHVNASRMDSTPVDSAQPTRQSHPALLHRALTRPAGLVALTGLAAGAGFAAVTGISSASPSTATSAASTSTASTSTSATASPTGSTSTAPATKPTLPGMPGAGTRHGGFGGSGGPGFGGLGFGHRGFGGGEGTVTAINGASLTLRTANGTETVRTTAATKYTKDRTTVSLASIKVGDVVRVAGPRPTATTKPTTPPTTLPGTGTVTATAIDVVLPMLSGRVSAVGSGQYTIVGRSGELLTISVGSSTRYYTGATKTTSAAVKVGTRIVAEGAQNTLTHLSADIVTVLPAPSAGAGWGHGGADR